MEGTTQRRGEAGQQVRRSIVFPWETDHKGRYCENCAYFPSEVDGSICLRCGRYISNKLPEVIIVAVLAVALAVLSNYMLTGRALRGTNTIWISTALQFPYSIYDSAEYRHAVTFTLAGLVALPVLLGFHYGALTAAAIGLAEGFFSGLPYGVLALPLVGAIASLRRSRRIVVLVWPILGLAGGLAYYLWLAETLGPADALHRQALADLLTAAAEFAALIALVGILVSSLMEYRSWVILPMAVFATAGPAALFFGGIGRAAFEANRVMTIFDPSETLSAELPEGYVTGLARVKRPDLTLERQAGHVFDTARYVDEVRRAAAGASDEYLKHFGDSPQAADVMLFKATMYNAKVDFAELTSAGRLETYFDRISPDAVPVYSEIIAKFGDTAQGALAKSYLAKATFQAGKLLDAAPLLTEAEKALAGFVAPDFDGTEAAPPANVRELYTDGSARRRQLEVRVYEALQEARRLQSLVAHNMDFAGQPLQRLAGLDARSEGFESDAGAIIAAYPSSRIVDNIKLTLALRAGDPAERTEAIGRLLTEYPDSDVRDQMLYEYAEALFLSNPGGEGADGAKPVLQQLLADFPSSTYRLRAVALLGRVNAAIATRGRS